MEGSAIGVAKVLTFFTVLAVTLLVTDVLVDAGLRRIDTSVFGVFNRIIQGRINADIIVSGSSRALNHFDPRILHERTGRSAFNIGINGSQTDMQVAVLRTYLEHNRRPALVVQNLDSFTFVTSRKGLWFPAQYVPYLDEPTLYEGLLAIDPDFWKMRTLPLYGYAVHDMNFTWWLGLRGLFGWDPPEDRYLGFQPRFAAWNGEFAQFSQGNAKGVAFEVDPRGVNDLEALMELSRARGIAVLLVYSPVYHKMQDIEINRAAIFRQFRVIAERYGAQLWDYSDAPLSYRQEYFVNSQHLNAQGAALFSRQFADTLASSALLPR